MTTQIVSPGQTVNGTTIGGSSIFTEQDVYGIATNTIIYVLGLQFVYSGGFALDAIVDGGQQIIESGGVATGTTINSGSDFSAQFVQVGGIATATTVNAAQYVFGGSINDTTINTGASSSVFDGFVDGALVNQGGLLYIDEFDEHVSTGPTPVPSGGSLQGAIVLNNGTLQLAGGGQFTFNSGSLTDPAGLTSTLQGVGTLHIGDGGGAPVLVINGTVALENFSVIIGGNGIEIVSSGATVANTDLSLGEQIVYGVAIASAVNDGTQIVYGTAVGSIIDGYGVGTQEILFGGTATGTIVDSGLQEIFSGAVASGAVVSSGGEQDVLGGFASGTIVSPGGTQLVNGGLAVNTVLNGGSELVAYDGVATGTVVNSGGILTINNGAHASNTTINAGGTDLVEYGGTANGTIANSGSALTVYNGGKASEVIVNFGATAFIAPDGTIVDASINGGILELSAGAVASGTLAFSGSGGLLEIQGTHMPSAVIQGFRPGDVIDLTSLPISSHETVTLKPGNVLEITEGGATYDLQLSPADNFKDVSFRFSSDGSGGTDIIPVATQHGAPASSAYTLGLDTNKDINLDQALAIKAAGFQFVMQYIGDHTGALTTAKVADFEAAGLQIVTIYENKYMSDTDTSTGKYTKIWEPYFSINVAADGHTIAYDNGFKDAARAFELAHNLGQPVGSAVYFAIDLDPGSAKSGISEAQALAGIQQYFEGIAAYNNSLPPAQRHEIGVYGAGDTLSRISSPPGEGALAQFTWLAGAARNWAGTNAWIKNGGWSLDQFSIENSPQNSIDGINFDRDYASSSSFGAWGSHATSSTLSSLTHVGTDNTSTNMIDPQHIIGQHYHDSGYLI